MSNLEFFAALCGILVFVGVLGKALAMFFSLFTGRRDIISRTTAHIPDQQERGRANRNLPEHARVAKIGETDPDWGRVLTILVILLAIAAIFLIAF